LKLGKRFVLDTSGRRARPAAEPILLTLSLRELADLTAGQIRSERDQDRNKVVQ
jgi:hypothetical protein